MKSSEYTEEFPRQFRGNPKFGFLGISSEYTDGIPRKIHFVGIFRRNTEENSIPRKKPMNSEEILEPLESRWGDFKNSEEIPRAERFSSEFPRNRSCRFRDLIIHSFSSEFPRNFPRKFRRR
ncbi:hypothetical protein YC2023_122727 [Brassica napus]